jgi:hypothetical protein
VGTQYQFQVVPTDGTNEDPVQTFVYPTGQTQAAYTPSTITPTGKPTQIAVDNQYLSKDECLTYPSGLKLTTCSGLYTSGVLDTILLMASGEVNRYTHRHFNVQTIDSDGTCRARRNTAYLSTVRGTRQCRCLHLSGIFSAIAVSPLFVRSCPR